MILFKGKLVASLVPAVTCRAEGLIENGRSCNGAIVLQSCIKWVRGVSVTDIVSSQEGTLRSHSVRVEKPSDRQRLEEKSLHLARSGMLA